MLVLPDTHIDWFMVFRALKAEGYSYYSVSSLIGIPKNTLCGWADGAEPKHADGEKLIQFWCETMSKERTELPMAPRILSAAKAR